MKVVPVITNTSGDFTITYPVGSATIYYTTDGTDPTSSPTRQVYSSPFQLTGSDYKVRAVAVVGGRVTDEGTYIVVCAQPTIALAGATVTISSTTPGAVIRYTTNGSDPAASLDG